MKTFLKQLSFFFLFTIAITISVVSVYAYKNKISFRNIPAPNVSNSISYNEKILFIRNKKADIISIGSSMCLNNLHSGTIVDSLNSDSYLNLASWAQNIEEDYNLLRIYSSFYKPAMVIICSNIRDFRMETKLIDYSYVRYYLGSNIRFIYSFLKKLNLNYYTVNIKYKKIYTSSNKIYHSLIYDKYGAVLLDTTNFQMRQARWNNDTVKNGYQYNYRYLDSISNFCKHNNIKLLFIQSPFREGLAKRIANNTILLNHIYKVKKIVTFYGQTCINSNEETWPDSLFVDADHFDERGARKFTQYCLKVYNNIK